MNTSINPSLFRVTSPENDPNLATCFVPPTVLAALLNLESTLLAAPTGYGKSTLVYMARQQMQRGWLHICLEQPATLDGGFMQVLLRQITQGMWRHIEADPVLLDRLQARAAAVRYFLDCFSDIDVNYLLALLADDNPAHAEIIQKFQAIPVRELFSSTANDTQRLSVLCDCIQKLGLQGVILWIDLTQELQQLSPTFLQVLQECFDSLYLMRQSILFIKCLALPSVCQYLQTLRSMATLSVNSLALEWSREQLTALIEHRLAIASAQQVQTLDQLIDPKQFVAFLAEFSDPHNPSEWLALTRLIVESLQTNATIPLSEQTWRNVRRAYCAERIKIRLDEQGNFWLGKQWLHEITPKKGAIYPLVRFLYLHPGVHRPYNLRDKLGVDENNLNTIISRARKLHLEPFPPQANEGDEGWIYLVTDQGGGYALKHTIDLP